jgi:hypothetical protein
MPSIQIPDQPWPHQVINGSNVAVKPNYYADNPPTFGPAGRVHCAMRDWAKFATVHIKGFNGKDTSILKAKSFLMLHTRYPGQDYKIIPMADGSALTVPGPMAMH